jgi:V/A-type H+-transporting ATPase subunit B
MKDGIGKDFTRDDHPHVSNQLYALYARALETRNLASIIGADELSTRDQRYLEFADAFEQRFVSQSEDEDRSIVETLNLAWELLSMFPPEALTRVSETEMAKYHRHTT